MTHTVLLDLPERRVYLLYFEDTGWRTIPVRLGTTAQAVAAGADTTIALDRRAES